MLRLALLVCLVAAASPLADADGAPAVNRNRGYVFTAPKRLIAGETENVCLSLHNLEPPVQVSVDLLAVASLPTGVTPAAATNEDELLSSVRSNLKSGVETCLELRVTSSTKYTVAKLRLRLKFDKHPDYVVDTQKKVLIEHDPLVTFVETDKPIYKPGQQVNIRVLTLKHDLKPWIKPIPKVWIENPSEVRVAQWTNVTTENGMAQLNFPLSAEPTSGLWKIKVEKTRPQLIHTSSFEVKKYVLPRFQVTIAAPKYILADAKDATWKVCVRYSYGEPVKGTLILSLRPQTPLWKRKPIIAEINYEEKMEASTDGCTNYTVSAEALGLPYWKVAPNNVVLLANFTETRSGLVETASSRTLVMHQPLKLEFGSHTPKHFKPGLPYHGKLRVLKPDGSSPAVNEKIQLCLRIRRKDEWQRSVVECRNFTSPNLEGFLDFIVPPQPKNVVLLSFVATAVDYPTKYYSPDKRWRVFVDQPSAYIDVEPWYSASSSYLSVTRGQQPIACGEKYSFNVMYTSGNSCCAAGSPPEPITFHYSINSKGDLLVFGHVKYRPRKDTLLNYTEFRNVLGAANRTSGSQFDDPDEPLVHRFPLSVKITASMAPLSELLLYYVRADGEVVTASHSIEVGQCFENRVRTAWHEERQSPGSMARLHLEAAPWSLCGVSAVDRSTSFLTSPTQASSLLQPEAAFARLKPFHLAPEAPPLQTSWAHCDKSRGAEESGVEEGPEEEIDHLPRPAAKRSKRHSVTYNVGANYVDAIQAFDDFGAIVMSDLILESRPCPPWRSAFGNVPFGQASQEEIDEPDRMLKAVKAMPLAFQFSGPGVAAGEASVVGQDAIDSITLEGRTAAVVRSHFPETWLWELVPVGKDGKTTLERKLPDSITDWIGNAVCISVRHGLGIAAGVQVTAFQPFFLDYSLPYSARRGEQLRLKVSLYNYMGHSLPVRVSLLGYEGLDLAFNRSTEAEYCVGAKDSIMHEYLLLPRHLGELNVTVMAEVKRGPGADCGPETLPSARDELVKPVLVKPEGFPVELTNSAFLCPRDFEEDTSVLWELKLPEASEAAGDERVVEGSARAYVSVIGDVLGPALDNLERLVRLPMGCGEQNMMLFVPNIHAIAYLDAVNRHTGYEMRAKALRNMQKGYQRELNYRHPDGSYSAFGPADESASGSMWLTAFVVKSLAQARSMIHVDERDLKLSVKWIVRRQLENGCFPVVGQVFHKDMKGGLREEDGSSSALTAYVLVALLESGVPLSAALVNNALYCLEKASASEHLADNPYASALSTYALALLEHPRANESLRSLMARASRQNDLLWWEDRSRPGSLGLSIEMTAYALLSLTKLGGEANMLEALRAVRWMSRKRNAEGGFTSTQDTVVGLEALTKYAMAMANATATQLSVLLTADDLERVFRLDDENRMLLHRVELPTLPSTLELFAQGEGCLLVQSSLRYNKARPGASEAFELSASTETVSQPSHELEPPSDRCAIQRLNVCVRYKLPDEESNMAVLEIAMVTGFVPDRVTLHDLLDEPASGVKRFEENEDTVAIYFDKLTSQKTCISFQAHRENVVDNAEPGNIKLYDYYQQELTVSSSYKFVDVCEKKAPDVVENVAKVPGPRTMPQRVDRTAGSVQVLDDTNKFFSQVRRSEKMDPQVIKQRNAVTTEEPASFDSNDPGSGDSVDELCSPNPILPGTSVDVVDDGFLPSFRNVDHDLQTPEGVEGPVPVYVPAPSTTEKMREDANSGATGCPRCEDGLPSDLEELFCASSSAVKVAIRESRKVRLLLDLNPPSGPQRLRSKLELEIKPGCSCSTLDTSGILAVLMTSNKAVDYAKLHNSKIMLDENSSLFALPDSGDFDPPELKSALLACPRSV